MTYDEWLELWHEEACMHNDFVHEQHPGGINDYRWEIQRHKERVAELEELRKQCGADEPAEQRS